MIKQWIIITIIVFAGLFARLINLHQPIADWHSFRQVDTVSVTKIFSQTGLDFLHPRYHDLSSTQSGMENPQGYRMVEAPIYNTLSLFWHQVTGNDINISSRLISILLSLASGLFIYFFVLRSTAEQLPAALSLLVFMLLPFNVYYSRTTLPEPTAVFFTTLTLYLFEVNLLLAAPFFALALLIKPYVGLILAPYFIVTLFRQKKLHLSPVGLIKLIAFGLISLAPFVLWRLWINQFPEGIPQSNWLLNSGNTSTFPNWFHGYDLSFLNRLVAFRPHWWHWLFHDRLSGLILGSYGLIPLFLGVCYRKKYYQSAAFSFLVGILVYFIVIAQGNIQHDYYQVLIIPFVSILFGVGLSYIIRVIFTGRPIGYLVAMLILLFSFYFSLERVKEYYKINRPQIAEISRVVRQSIPSNSLVIAPNNGDTTLLYLLGYSGWPIEIYDFNKIITLHPHSPIYLVSINFDNYTNSLISKYPTISKSSDYIIFKISP